MAKKRAQRKAPPPAPAAAQGGVAKRKKAARQQAGQQKRRQQQAEGAQAAAPATAGRGKAALGAQAQTAAKAPPTKKQRKAQAWRKRLVQQLQQRRAAKAATARKKPAAAKPPVPRRPASRKAPRKPGTASGQAVQQQQQPAGARKKAGNRKQQPKQQPAAATPASKRKQLGKRKQQTAAAGTKPPAAAAAPGKRKREQLEAGTHYFCLDTNVLLQQAQLGVRAAWQAIAASPDSPVQLLVPLVRPAELWVQNACFCGVPRMAFCFTMPSCLEALHVMLHLPAHSAPCLPAFLPGTPLNAEGASGAQAHGQQLAAHGAVCSPGRPGAAGRGHALPRALPSAAVSERGRAIGAEHAQHGVCLDGPKSCWPYSADPATWGSGMPALFSGCVCALTLAMLSHALASSCSASPCLSIFLSLQGGRGVSPPPAAAGEPAR